MAKQKTWKWSGGGTALVTYEGDKDGTAVFSSSVNEDTDRGIAISFVTSDKTKSVSRMLRQVGRRETFSANGEDFVTADDEQFTVIKDGL